MEVSLGHTSQNGQKLEDQINKLNGNNGTNWFETDFDSECTIMFRQGVTGLPRRSPRANGISTGHTNCIIRQLSFDKDLTKAPSLAGAPRKATKKKTAMAPTTMVETTPDKSVSSNGDRTPAMEEASPASFETPDTQAGVEVILNEDEGNTTLPS